MPLNLVRQGGGVFRNLPVNGAVARPVRVISSQHHVRRIAFVARRSPVSITRSLPCISSTIGHQVRSYASSERPAKPAGSKSTASKKSTTTKKPAKVAKQLPKKSAKKPTKKPAKKQTPRKKKPLTEAQIERRNDKERREKLRQLKETALKLPKKLPYTLHTVAFADKFSKADRSDNPSQQELFSRVSDLVRLASPEEKQRYTEQVKANKVANDAALKAFVESYTPLQILEANRARRRLAKLRNKQRCTLIDDERLVKSAMTGWLYFLNETRDKNASIPEASRTAASEWKNLSVSEKSKYYRLAEEDQARYQREYLKVYGQPAPSAKKKQDQQ
ncbi:hypothetical protein BDW74DRAFT_152140 [Aspergillus multicolor]|uniref:uncharacterized protein n=1 Tax=Aspergillus multicolor TaxID=41759 RepID=UPI003CCE4CF5